MEINSVHVVILDGISIPCRMVTGAELNHHSQRIYPGMAEWVEQVLGPFR